MPGRLGISAEIAGNRVGRRMANRTANVQSVAAPIGSTQPSKMASKVVGGTKERRHQRTAQVVDEPPTTAQRDAGAVLRLGRAIAKDPRQQLPITTHPSLLARRRNLIFGRILLDNLNIRSAEHTSEL